MDLQCIGQMNTGTFCFCLQACWLKSCDGPPLADSGQIILEQPRPRPISLATINSSQIDSHCRDTTEETKTASASESRSLYSDTIQVNNQIPAGKAAEELTNAVCMNSVCRLFQNAGVPDGLSQTYSSIVLQLNSMSSSCNSSSHSIDAMANYLWLFHFTFTRDEAGGITTGLGNLIHEIVEGFNEENSSTIPFDSSFGVDRDHYLLLYIVSGWLGCEFRRAQHSVAGKVEEFKRQFLHSMSQLPPCQTILNTIYPAFMHRLLHAWLGEDTSHTTDTQSDTDHSYIGSVHPGVHLRRIQLLLEVATGSLISPLSHIVNYELNKQ